MAENERPWNYELIARFQHPITDEELEALVDRLVPARVSIEYRPREGRIAFRGWTFSEPVWDHFTYIKNTVRGMFPTVPVAWTEAHFGEGQTEDEAKADLDRLFPGLAA